jgi:multiple sugar transport system permease protein
LRRDKWWERRHFGAPFFVPAKAFTVTSLSATARASFGERNFKYLLIGPAIFVLLLIGIFPLVYLLLVSFQGITMTETATDFVGGRNYAQLFEDVRLWQALLHTVIFTAIALPVELLLGLMMAQLFLDRIPGRQIFIALLDLPEVVSPIVSGATWS